MDEQRLEAAREGSRAMWAAGHYPTVAERLRPVAESLVALESMGRWDEVWPRVRESNRHANLATDGTYVMEQRYLLAVGTKAG